MYLQANRKDSLCENWVSIVTMILNGCSDCCIFPGAQAAVFWAHKGLLIVGWILCPQANYGWKGKWNDMHCVPLNCCGDIVSLISLIAAEY